MLLMMGPEQYMHVNLISCRLQHDFLVTTGEKLKPIYVVHPKQYILIQIHIMILFIVRFTPPTSLLRYLLQCAYPIASVC